MVPRARLGVRGGGPPRQGNGRGGLQGGPVPQVDLRPLRVLPAQRRVRGRVSGSDRGGSRSASESGSSSDLRS